MDWGQMLTGHISAANASWPVDKLSKILPACAEETLPAVLNTPRKLWSVICKTVKL